MPYLTDFIKHETSKGLYTSMIMLDLQKAFDTVDHLILCEKIGAMGVCSVDWFVYNPSGRKFVQVNGNLSDSSPISCTMVSGPQGSTLGPLLFLCYVNDMTVSISPECKLLSYADDSTILFFLIKILKLYLGNSAHNWNIAVNGLSTISYHFILVKQNISFVWFEKKIRKVHNFEVECSGHTIKAQSSVKYLDVNLDKFLSGGHSQKALLAR